MIYKSVRFVVTVLTFILVGLLAGARTLLNLALASLTKAKQESPALIASAKAQARATVPVITAGVSSFESKARNRLNLVQAPASEASVEVVEVAS